MTFQTCTCPCHSSTIYDAGWCNMCANNHLYSPPSFEPQDIPAVNTKIAYDAMIFAVLQEIRDLIKDIKRALVGDDKNGKKRGAKSRKTNRSKP